MANEIHWVHTATGATVYATIRSAARTYWYTVMPALEALTMAHWADYDIALTESPASSYFHVGDWPAALTTVGFYWVDVFSQAGAGPVRADDTLLGTLIGYWNGTALLPWAADTEQVAGTAQTARDLGADTTELLTRVPEATLLAPYMGAIWFDGNASNTNTVVGVDGLPGNPVSDAASVATLIAATGFKMVRIRGWFIMNFGLSLARLHFAGWQDGIVDKESDHFDFNWCDTDALNGAFFSGLSLANIPIDGHAGYLIIHNCGMHTDCANASVYGCFLGDMQIGNDLYVVNCMSDNNSLSLDLSTMSDGYGTIMVKMKHNNVIVSGLSTGLGGKKALSLDLDGKLTLDATCVGGMLNLYGNCELVDNSGGLVTVNDYRTMLSTNANALGAQAKLDVNAEVDTALANYDPPTNTEMEARTLPSADYVVVTDLPAAAPSVSDIKTKLEEDGGKLDHLWETTENDGGVRRFTANALEMAPTGSSGSGSGTGTYTDTVTDGTNPVDGVRIVLYTDAAMTHVAYEAYTDALGIFLMHPDPGTYYRKIELAGYTGTQGVQVVVT